MNFKKFPVETSKFQAMAYELEQMRKRHGVERNNVGNYLIRLAQAFFSLRGQKLEIEIKGDRNEDSRTEH